ncbi:hypothetical protein H8N03_25135 [Ramlibacter sp. USB13]|uniref:LapA family protein n=1 Tax=Ramlibacter cellulosilyticus TaxID=2764187 RepID=A0A923MWB9_9BURK|nr:hypothetical protein [Ramlibacter cellulosilyticus]MBC5786246.1 hypothetical protein [Ramlibacter cellulosilyticus]
MRARTTLLVLAILLVAGFAALNWSEIVRPTPLSFGLMVTDAPLGLILLALLGLTLVLFLASSAAMRTASLMEYRTHQKTLEAQRELADKAEASRFTDLRQHLDTHLKEMRERDAIAASEFDKAMLQSRREVQAQMEQMNRMLNARLNEMEQRLAGRTPAMAAPVRNEVVAPAHDPALAAREAQLREQRLREEERLRDERIREQRDVRNEERAQAVDKPAESGWRKWF